MSVVINLPVVEGGTTRVNSKVNKILSGLIYKEQKPGGNIGGACGGRVKQTVGVHFNGGDPGGMVDDDERSNERMRRMSFRIRTGDLNRSMKLVRELTCDAAAAATKQSFGRTRVMGQQRVKYGVKHKVEGMKCSSGESMVCSRGQRKAIMQRG